MEEKKYIRVTIRVPEDKYIEYKKTLLDNGRKTPTRDYNEHILNVIASHKEKPTAE